MKLQVLKLIIIAFCFVSLLGLFSCKKTKEESFSKESHFHESKESQNQSQSESVFESESEAENQSENENQSDKEPDSESGPEVPVTNITFEEFIANYSEEALSFANEYVYDDLVANKTPLSQTWGFNANENDELTTICLSFTYATNDKERVVEVANYTFTDPIDLNKIVDGSVTNSETAGDVKREVAFEFNAKETYVDEDIANALFKVIGSNSEKKYYKEVECETAGMREFQIADETANAINVYTVTIYGNTDKEIIENSQSPVNYFISQTATYPLGDKKSVTFPTQNYEIEEFAPENIEEAVKDFSQEITSALDTYYKEILAKKCIGRTYDSQYLQDVVWNIGEGETLDKIQMLFNYGKSETSKTFAIGTLTFNTPINASDLTKENINSILENAEYKTEQSYIYSYNPQIQGTRDDLVNAIFEAYGMTKECPDNAVRYFIDHGDTLDGEVGEARRFTVVEISNNKVIEFTIRIKSATSDLEYIEKLNNTQNFRITGEKSATYEGKKLSSLTNEATENSIFEEDEDEMSM